MSVGERTRFFQKLTSSIAPSNGRSAAGLRPILTAVLESGGSMFFAPKLSWVPALTETFIVLMDGSNVAATKYQTFVEKAGELVQLHVSPVTEPVRPTPN